MIGGATALLLLGGGIGFALNDGVQLLYQQADSAEIAERAAQSPGCEPPVRRRLFRFSPSTLQRPECYCFSNQRLN